MKQEITQLIADAIVACQGQGILPADIEATIQIERTRDKSHGDFACNIAMMLAKPAKSKPRDLAEKIVAAIPVADFINKIEIAGPGFINFYLNEASLTAIVPTILQQGEQYGRSEIGAGQSIQVEYVSANPTGPLHVGHGRGAAYGACVANLLDAVGYKVHREYYVNDAGRQMNILAASVWLRYLELCGEEFAFPGNGYKGDYVLDIAASLHRENKDAMYYSWAEVSKDLPADEPEGGDKEIYIDALIDTMKALLRPDQYQLVFDIGLNYILDDIRDDLEKFGVVYDKWYSERSLTENGAVMLAIERLQKSGYTYEKEGAIWFKSTAFDDEKDRVLVRDNGQTTYFASDIAYHMDKFERGFDKVIDIWGADHHGYVPRVKAALQALGYDPNKLGVLLVQFAVLYRGGQKAQMSTRSGEFVTLRHLRKEVGSDAARFFYAMRKCEQHLDFDLDLAVKKSNENPLFYIQYAHARICNVMRKLAERQLSFTEETGLENLDKLEEPAEHALMQCLMRLPEVVESAAGKHEPHQLLHYMKDVATNLHTYYDTDNKRIVILHDDEILRNARLCLINATRQVIANGLHLLGVSAPESM